MKFNVVKIALAAGITTAVLCIALQILWPICMGLVGFPIRCLARPSLLCPSGMWYSFSCAMWAFAFGFGAGALFAWVYNTLTSKQLKQKGLDCRRALLCYR